MTIQGWLAAVREMPEEGAELGQDWADAQDVPGIVPSDTLGRAWARCGTSSD